MFKGLGQLANLGGLMKQAQEMSAKMKELSESLKTKRVTGSAGAGLVEVGANGVGEVLAVRIDHDLFAKQDREFLEDLIPAAVNSAQDKAKALYAEEMNALTGGLNLPGLGDALGQFGSMPPQ